ncbi:alpha/beta fold hydrolase [Marinoscillum sp. 108]|uniref:alpha/beta fold hydrolase n=1 Tax=Marinoscillum sp. 108 TaxID=2653151 RepID=UPI001359D7F0|nr:alpha/beta hydrolase [Marinoscillum sp. 108]
MTKVTKHFAKASTQYLKVNGIDFAYRRFGNSKNKVPLVGFQHFTGTLDNWDPLIMDALAAEREVIVFDNVGVGNSGGNTPNTVESMTADAVLFIKALGLSKIDVLGFSLGGFIAQHLGIYYSDLIRRIIMVGTAPQGAEVLTGFAQLIEHAMSLDPEERFLKIFFTDSESSREAGRSVLQRLNARKHDRDVETSVDSIMAQMKAISAWATPPVEDHLSQIDHPVFIVQGSDDEMMDSNNSYVLFKSLPNATLSYYPDAAHGSFYQYPETFAVQANDFLDHFK